MYVHFFNRSSENMNAQSQRQLEWELGRVELMMEGVSKNKAGINDRMEIVRGQQEQKGKYIIYTCIIFIKNY